MNKLPVYKAVLSEEEDGIVAISLVEHPAIEEGWLMLSQEEVAFAADEEKRLLTGPVLIPDKPIFRRRGDEGYYIVFSKDTIQEIAQRMLKTQAHNNVDEQHNGKMIDGVELMELYLTDANKGVNFDVPEGSLIATYKVLNDAVWQKAREGKITGFSLSGLFTIVEDVEEDDYTELLAMLKKIRHCK